MDTFTTPPTEDIYSLDTMHFMVSQMTKEQSKKGGRAIIESVIPTDFEKADPPPKKKRVPWNKGKKGSQKSWNKIPSPDKAELEREYFDNKLSIDVMASIYSVSKTVIRRWLKDSNIPIKTLSMVQKETYERGRIPHWQGKRRPDVSGENNPRWRGGWDTYYGPTWYSAKRKTRERDQGICYMCSANEKDHPKRFDIHHIEPYRISQDNSLENLMTLCPSCHKRMDAITEGNTFWKNIKHKGRRPNPSKGKTYEEIYGKEKALELKKKLSKSHIGQKPWNKGKTDVYSEETLKKLSKASEGRIGYWRGKKFSDEHRKNLSKAQKSSAISHEVKP